MQELERILEEIDAHAIEFEIFGASDDYISVGWAKDIIRKHMNDGWISVEKRLPERRVRYAWITVDHGTIWQRMLAKWDGKDFKNIYGAELYCKIIAWQECKTPEPYRPERSVEE